MYICLYNLLAYLHHIKAAISYEKRRSLGLKFLFPIKHYTKFLVHHKNLKLGIFLFS